MWSIGNEVLEQWNNPQADTLDLQQANLLLNFGAGRDSTVSGDLPFDALLTKTSGYSKRTGSYAARDGRMQRAGSGTTTCSGQRRWIS